MKKITSFLFLITVATAIDAQSISNFRVTYLIEHSIDTNNITFKRRETFALYFSAKETMFRSRVQEQNDSSMIILEKKVNNGEINTNNEITLPIRPADRTEYFTNNVSKRIFKKVGSRPNNYIIEEVFPQIKWTLIKSEKKKILNKACNKAEGIFGGRKYTVWYTTEIPTWAGPWKLNGLPGLILQAQDTRNEVMFLAQEINDKIIPVKIEFPPKSISATQAQYDRMIGNKSVISDPNVKVENIKIDGISTSGKKRNIANNPLELTNGRTRF